MKSRKFYLFSLILLCVIFRQSSISAQTPAPTPAVIGAQNTFEIRKAEADLIHQGDLIDVDVVGSVEYDWRGTINPEGFLDVVDFAENPIYALCRSEQQIAATVAQAYGKILREPKVVVKILDRSNRPLAILYGAVKTPQRFQIRRPIFLNELLVVAGGLTEKSSGEIQIFRPKSLSCQSVIEEKPAATTDGGGKNRETFVAASQNSGGANYINVKISDLLMGKKDANLQILSGDIVTVVEAESIYVTGGVVNPKQIASRAQITLSRAVASAGGLTKNASAGKVTIFRREAGETKVIETDLERIKNGETEDLILRPFDIVEVAQTGREKTKFPPILKAAESSESKISNLPLRIID
jgi:polysaccharide export outer membrane protein